MPKSERQKLKIFYIADYLMRETDEELDENKRPVHGVLVKEIKSYLKEQGIDAEEHAISRDIDLLRGIKKTSAKKEHDIPEDKANEAYFDNVLDIRGGKGKPIYLGTRYLPFEDLEIIVECVASACFISKAEAEKLIDKLKDFCSKYQAERLTNENIVAERPKYAQGEMIKRLRIIKEAIRQKKKIAFYYTKHNTKDFSQTELRSKGKLYSVSPFKVVLSEGKHYLVCYDDEKKQIRAYRIDRMTKVQRKAAQIEGKDTFDHLGISDYAKQVFGMFIDGKGDYITIQFDKILLDAMIERFGYNSGTTKYTQVDNNQFTVRTFIVRSEKFYGWMCGFDEKAFLVSPPDAVKDFKEYLKKIEAKYV